MLLSCIPKKMLDKILRITNTCLLAALVCLAALIYCKMPYPVTVQEMNAAKDVKTMQALIDQLPVSQVVFRGAPRVRLAEPVDIANEIEVYCANCD